MGHSKFQAMGSTQRPPRLPQARISKLLHKQRMDHEPKCHGLTKMGKYCQPKSSIGSWRIKGNGFSIHT